MCYAVNRKRRKVNGRLKVLQRLQPSSTSIATLQAKLVALEKEAQQKIHEYLNQEEQRALHAMQSNPRYFYSYAKKRNVCKSKIGPLRSVNSENESALFCDDPKGMADILQTQFTSVFSNPQNTHRTRSDID